jgi:hypothetical protein
VDVFQQNDRAADILSQVREQFGISFTETMTGGGCMALEARLESGHWIVAVDECLMGFVARIATEAELDDDGERHYPMGWSVGIYPDMGEDEWFGAESVVDINNLDAFAEELPEMVQRALEQLLSAAR